MGFVCLFVCYFILFLFLFIIFFVGGVIEEEMNLEIVNRVLLFE